MPELTWILFLRVLDEQEAIVGAGEVKGWGGAVHSIPLLPGRSTTSVIERIGPFLPIPFLLGWSSKQQ